jgi:hypothetical protein
MWGGANPFSFAPFVRPLRRVQRFARSAPDARAIRAAAPRFDPGAIAKPRRAAC